jgi:hypothetical protein
MISRVVRTTGVWAATAGCAAALEVAGRVLPAPPIAHPGLLGEWFRSVGPPTAVFSGLRLALLAALLAWGACLAVCTGACALGQGRRLSAWTACLRRPTGAAVVRLALGLTAGSGAVSACGPGAGPPSPPVLRNLAAPARKPNPPVLRNLAAPAGTPTLPSAGGRKTAVVGGVGDEQVTTRQERAGTAGGVAGRRRTDTASVRGGAAPTATNRPGSRGASAEHRGGGPAIAANATTAARSRQPASGAAGSAGPPTTPAPDGAPARAGEDQPEPGSSWSVRPGESFWSIAAAALASANGTVPSKYEVARYWLEVVGSNLSRLPPPHDPNLIYPGQVLLLPPPPRPAPPHSSSAAAPPSPSER